MTVYFQSYNKWHFYSHKQEKINISRKLKKAHLEEKKAKAKKEIEAKKEQIQKDREELKSKKAAHEQLYEMPDGRRFNSGELTRILDQQEQVWWFLDLSHRRLDSPLSPLPTVHFHSRPFTFTQDRPHSPRLGCWELPRLKTKTLGI